MDGKTELFRIVNEGLIKDKTIIDFTLKALNAANEEFWHVPSSSSGKYHPPEDQGEGGLVRHVLKGIEVIKEISRRELFEQYETDCTLSAFTLYDIKKNGEPWEKDTDYRHGIIAANWLQQFELEITKKKMITDAVRYHMSPWNTIFSNERYFELLLKKENAIFTGKEISEEINEKVRGLNPNKIEAAVQQADYWSSRKNISYFPGIAVILDVKHDTPKQ